MNAVPNDMHSTGPIVLVIDDNIHFVKCISKILEYEGYRVYTALNGEQGVIKYDLHQPDLIITDIFMPEKDGLALILEVRNKIQKSLLLPCLAQLMLVAMIILLWQRILVQTRYSGSRLTQKKC